MLAARSMEDLQSRQHGPVQPHHVLGKALIECIPRCHSGRLTRLPGAVRDVRLLHDSLGLPSPHPLVRSLHSYHPAKAWS